MVRKATAVLEPEEHGIYAWCPELKGCQSQGATVEEAMAHIKEAIELYLDTLPQPERDELLLSRRVITTAVGSKRIGFRVGVRMMRSGSYAPPGIHHLPKEVTVLLPAPTHPAV